MKAIEVEIVVHCPIQKVWDFFTLPSHIVQWNHASDDWHCPKAENNLTNGGHFSFLMAAKDGSSSFDFNGTYSRIDLQKEINYTIEGGRQVQVIFEKLNETTTKIIEIFEAEEENTEELQRSGWQSILSNFKSYTEN